MGWAHSSFLRACSQLFSHWELEAGHGGSIYTVQIYTLNYRHGSSEDTHKLEFEEVLGTTGTGVDRAGGGGAQGMVYPAGWPHGAEG